MKFHAALWKNCNEQKVSPDVACVVQNAPKYVRGQGSAPTPLGELMVLLQITIITITLCCDNLWKSKFVALEKSGKLRDYFFLLCGHPDLA